MKVIQIALLSTVLLLQLSLAQAAKIFVSNNTKIISPSEAYKRLYGEAQDSLQHKTIRTLQQFHYQQGRISRALGAYHMKSANKITADNTLVFTTAPNDVIKKQKAVQTATFLAKQFHQEAVALFIDNDTLSGSDIVIKFNNKHPRYDDIKKKMFLLESKGLASFSLYFQGKQGDFNHQKISAIEWLTTHEKREFLKKLFKDGSVQERHGEASLVFKDGHTEHLA